MATDTGFSNTPASYDGSIMAQFFVARILSYVMLEEAQAKRAEETTQQHDCQLEQCCMQE